MVANNPMPLVLVVGATGYTGRSIVRGLVAAGNFRVVALVRPSSVSKPSTEEFRIAGVEIRVGDAEDGEEKLKEILAGVEILISAIDGWLVDAQRDLFRAAKAVGTVKRAIPCDFGTPGARGVQRLRDAKFNIRDFIKGLGIGYTFIDVGWWMQLALPLPERSKAIIPGKENTYEVHNEGVQKILVTDHRHIGRFVARIIADPRTLNQAVIIWEDEVTQLKSHEIGEHASGGGESLKARRTYLSTEDVLRRISEGKELIVRNPADIAALFKVTWNEYANSMYILGENTLDNTKKLGYLDAHELYPDEPQSKLEDFAKEYYALEEPGMEYIRFQL
ncbi:NAD-P-binding protein [Trametes meyenii]|nr:NAD-P-binding protein [Trametes meyenii]